MMSALLGVKFIITGIFLNFICGRRALLEFNIEPQITETDEAYLDIRNVPAIVRRIPWDLFVENSCLELKSTNGPESRIIFEFGLPDVNL